MDYRIITTKRQFKDCISMSREEFELLCKDFNTYYKKKYKQTYEEYLEYKVQEIPKFLNLNDALFFVLFQKKNDLICGSLGAVFNMDGSSAHLNYNRFNELLEETLKKKEYSPHGVLKK